MDGVAGQMDPRSLLPGRVLAGPGSGRRPVRRSGEGGPRTGRPGPERPTRRRRAALLPCLPAHARLQGLARDRHSRWAALAAVCLSGRNGPARRRRCRRTSWCRSRSAWLPTSSFMVLAEQPVGGRERRLGRGAGGVCPGRGAVCRARADGGGRRECTVLAGRGSSRSGGGCAGTRPRQPATWRWSLGLAGRSRYWTTCSIDRNYGGRRPDEAGGRAVVPGPSRRRPHGRREPRGTHLVSRGGNARNRGLDPRRAARGARTYNGR